MRMVNDAIWNYAAFLVMALSGVMINLALAIVEGSEALGVFNQTMAFFVIASHLAVLGAHNAALHFTAKTEVPNTSPQNTTTPLINSQASDAVLRSCLIFVFFPALLLSALSYLAAPWFGELLQSQTTAGAIRYASIGLFFFAINKVLLGYLNGAKRMREFAIGLSLRYLGILATVLVWIFSDSSLVFLGIAFLLPEFILFLLLLIRLRSHVYYTRHHESSINIINMAQTAKFSLSSFGAGMLNETNLRVDVIVIGIFLSDSVVGVYSFAALFVEGFYNIGLVCRNILNPYLVEAFNTRRFDFLNQIKNPLFGFLLLLSALTVGGILLLFDPIVISLMGLTEFSDALSVLSILLPLLGLYFLFIPYEEIILHSGHPLHHTVLYVGIVLLNFAFNFLLIPWFGIVGAAMATGMAFLLMSVAICIYTYRYLGINILPLYKIQVQN